MRESVFLLAFGMVATAAVLIARYIAGAISGRGARSDLAQVREQLGLQGAALQEAEATLAHQATQLAELQERLDFTERLLVQGRDRTALEPGDQRE